MRKGQVGSEETEEDAKGYKSIGEDDEDINLLMVDVEDIFRSFV